MSEHPASRPSPSAPRIEPLDPSSWTDEMRQLLQLPLEGHRTQEVPEFLSTLVRHPGLYRRFAGLTGKLLTKGKLAPRDRELAILRGAWLTQCPYEWGEHVAIGHSVLTSDEIERICTGAAHPAWNTYERAVLQAVDELHGSANIRDATWNVLAATLDDKQLIELVTLIGTYQMIAYLQNALRVRLRADNPGLSAR